jgi:uncharacterized membrane protein
MRYVVQIVTEWPRTVVAVNIGGAVIPTFLSLFLVMKKSAAAMATSVVTIACYMLAQGARARTD